MPADPPPTSSKELYRRIQDLITEELRGETGARAIRLATERLIAEMGELLGLRGVRFLEPRIGRPGSDPPDVLRIETPRTSERLAFDLAPDASPERVELVLSVLRSILSAALLEREFESAMRQAEEIQRSLLRQAPPLFDGFEIALRSIPAEEVGGDLYDFLPLEEDTLGLSIGDASGHGLPAALIVRDVVIGLRMGMEKDFRPGHILTRLNHVIHDSALSSCFVSLFYAELERNGNLFYFNAGHEPPLLFVEDRVVSLAYGDTVIGPLADARFKRHFAHVDHGATLVLYTDGLTERAGEGGELFGVDRLKDAVSRGLGGSVQGIVESVFSASQAFGAGRPWKDDATLVVVRRLP